MAYRELHMVGIEEVLRLIPRARATDGRVSDERGPQDGTPLRRGGPRGWPRTWRDDGGGRAPRRSRGGSPPGGLAGDRRDAGASSEPRVSPGGDRARGRSVVPVISSITRFARVPVPHTNEASYAPDAQGVEWVAKREADMGWESLLAEAVTWLLARHLGVRVPDAAFCDDPAERLALSPYPRRCPLVGAGDRCRGEPP